MKKILDEYDSMYLWSSGDVDQHLHWSLRIVLLPFYIGWTVYHCLKGTNIKVTLYKEQSGQG